MATIGKTFSDPDKWEEPWFISLSPGKKLLYTYLWERCDHAGVIHITLPLWSAHTGLKIDEALFQEFVQEVNEDVERIMVFKRKLWFTEYIRFNQQGDPSVPLSEKYSFHKHVVKIIRKHGITEEVNKRDPILLENFMQNDFDVSIEESIHPKPSLSLNEELTKPTGKGAGKGRGEEGERGEGLPPVKGKEFNSKGTNLEKEMRDSGMLDDTPF